MQLTIKKPDDWHVHLRDGVPLEDVVGWTASHFGRAIVMPNLKPPVTNVAQALSYRQRILDAIKSNSPFEPLMTLYLTTETSTQDIEDLADTGAMAAVKWYPQGATTHSDWGVNRIDQVISVFETMAKRNVPLLVHGEVVDAEVDVFDRERVFIETMLAPLVTRLPELRIVLEHISCEAAVNFVQSSSDNIAATITPQHLLLNRNHLLAGGLRPHYYCAPILKLEQDRRALVAAATGDHAKFFLGTDSAPHSINDKQSDCGCAGVFSTPVALALYTKVFEDAGKLNHLEAFASLRGPHFYRLPVNDETVTLIKKPWKVPDHYPYAAQRVVPMFAGETLDWQIDVS